MEPITLRAPEKLLEELADEAEELGFSSRSEYIRHILRNRSGIEQNTIGIGPNTRSSDATDRLDELEDRIAELEAEYTLPPQNAENDAQSDSTPETMNPLTADEEMAGSAGGSAPVAGDGVDEELTAAWDEWIEAEGPNTLHGKEMMRDLLERLRREQIVATAELREAWYDEWPDAYGDAKSLWDSMKRHVEGAPGVEHPGTGQWRYAGDAELREELTEYLPGESS